MLIASRLGGVFVSALCHGLILLIPISLATKVPKTFPPVELVMTLAEKPLASEPAPQAAEPPKPEPPKPKVKPKPRPQPRPVVREPVEAKSFIPLPVAPPRPAAPPAPVTSTRPRPSSGSGAPGPVGPVSADFGSASGPSFLRRVMPAYPETARRLGKEGRVVLRLCIDARGNLQSVQVVQGAGFGFEESAMEAVRRSSFRPAMIQGEPRACIARLPIKFALKN